MEGSRLKYGFLANHSLLVERLEPMGLLPFLVSENVVSFEERQLIQNEVTSTLKVGKLLTIVHRKGVSDPGIYQRLLGVMREAEATSGQQLEYLVKGIVDESRKEGIEKQFEYATEVLEERSNAALRKHVHTLVQGLIVDEILPQLISTGVISPDENVVIRSGSTDNDRARRLINLLHQKATFGFVRFVVALLDSESHQSLGKLLSDGDPFLEALVRSEKGKRLEELLKPNSHLLILDDEKYVSETLKRGHVPPRHSVYVERRKITEKILTELYKLKESDGWVVVHGMAGFGKTVLAAEAVRDAKLLREVFPGGVNWLTVGQMTDRNGDVDTPKLLIRIQNLISRLDEDQYRHPKVDNLEAATDYLQKVITEQHPRSLLVLDDVWAPEVAQAFAVRCRTMVTSRNSTIASSVATPRIFSVSVSEGFTDEEGRKLLALWLGKKPEELPSPYADIILEYCRGSPMAIALIGAILRKNAREAKWRAVTDKLKQKHFHSLKLHAAVNEWNYQHPTLNASIELSVESLPDNLKKYFEMLVVFDYDTFVPADALETIWGTDTLDTEAFMMELVGYSLAQQANPGAENANLLFYVHDIVLDFLKDTVSSERQVVLHERVVQRYTDKCGGAFATLPNDNYVYHKLLNHVAASGNSDLLGDLMSSLRWLVSSVQYGDANTVLANYREYKCKVSEQFVSAVQQFEFFVSSHMYVLANEPKREDIIQLALLLPDSSEVFMQATTMVSGDRKKSWFKWSNKESDPEKYALKLKLHNGGVRRCQYSSDGTTVVSCSSEGDVKLWDASTGMVLAEFKGHKKEFVTWCVMSGSGKIIASSSEDLTVKVWDARKKKLLVDFTEHRYGVQCCAISPDEKFILSADIDSCAKLWESRTGKVKASWRLSAVSPVISPATTPMDHPDYTLVARTTSEGNEGVLCCAFAPDGASVVTGAQGGAVRSWTLLGQLISTYSGHMGQVRGCVFNRDGTLLATVCVGDCTAKVWDASTTDCLSTFQHSGAVLSCDFSPDATKLITGDTEGFVKVWSVPLGTMLQELPLHWDFVNCVLFSPSGQHILSAADNGIIKILWSDQDNLEDQAPALVYHRRFSAQFKKVGASYEPTILCYKTKEKKMQIVKGSKAELVLQQLPMPKGYTPRSWIISNNGTMVVIGYEEGMLQVISLLPPPPNLTPTSGEEQWSAKELWRRDHAHDGKVLKCYFAPDDSKIATCSITQHKTWSAKDGKELAIVSGCGIGVRLCVFFKDNVKIASAQEKGVLVWSSDTGVPQLRCEGIIRTPSDSILCINVSEDNKRLVASATSGMVMVWNSQTGDILLRSTVVPLSPCARSCALSPNGSIAASGFDDGSLKIWDVARGVQVAYCPTVSDYWMIDIGFSPDGSRIVTLCDSIEWWKTDGTHLKTVLLKGTFGKYIKFSPDFCTFVTIDNAGLLYILSTLTV